MWVSGRQARKVQTECDSRMLGQGCLLRQYSLPSVHRWLESRHHVYILIWMHTFKVSGQVRTKAGMCVQSSCGQDTNLQQEGTEGQLMSRRQVPWLL